ncbi:MAG TPA: RimK family alpha-L-glutamate ligase [Chromatiales bacterium]|nr:RimK family alpha-L-glutamate ligase [Thiotrichales bacterium]HIP68976.1 RimK family alpha-L-glutamate ligase [Chromatiales bacterium]
MTRRIAIITDEPGWHGAQLKRALRKAGYESLYVSLTDCSFDINSGRNAVTLPGFENSLPDGVFVRGVPGGSLEEVIFYLDILHALRELGVCVYNDARSIERTVDKAMTSFLLHQAGIATPTSWVVAGIEAAKKIVRRELATNHQLVYKPLFGSQGKGLKLIGSLADLESAEEARGIYYLQRFIKTGQQNATDWRVFVINGKAVTAMQRTGTGWITNVAHGASCQPALLTPELSQLAESAVAVLDMHYAGVDLLRDEQGQYWVIEVNSIPAWKGLQTVCELDVSELLIKDFLAHCTQQIRMEAGG